MKRASIIIVILAMLSGLRSVMAGETKMKQVPRLPGAVLLLGYPPLSITMTNGVETQRLEKSAGGKYVNASLSADGSVIATALNEASDPLRWFPAIYALKLGKWTEYRNIDLRNGPLAISADGSQIAYATPVTNKSSSLFYFLNLSTGMVTRGPEMEHRVGIHMSWSPDGRCITFDMEVERTRNGSPIPPLRGIYVLDVEAGTVRKVAEGMSPSWSPSGKWIVFYGYSPGRDDVEAGWYATNANRVSVVHPDGTGSKDLITFSSNEELYIAPVWSPDSKTILINRFRCEDKDTVDIYLLDIATDKLTRAFENAPPVYGWAAAK